MHLVTIILRKIGNIDHEEKQVLVVIIKLTIGVLHLIERLKGNDTSG